MSDQEVRDLWGAVNGLRDEVSKTNTLTQSSMARIEAMLSERCEARVKRIEELETTQGEHDKRIDKLEQLRAQILLLAALGSIVGGGAVAWLFRLFGG